MTSRSPVIAKTVERMRDMHPADARELLSDFLAAPTRCFQDGHLNQYVKALDFNAHLVTALREGQVLFGREPVVMEDDGA